MVREYYAPFDTGPKTGSAEVYLHEMPGGQYTNLKEQAESMGLGARWHEIARTYAEVNLAFGDIVKVTPSSKVVGDMAIFLVNHNMTMHQFEQCTPDHNLTLPSSVIEMFMGSLGEPEGGWPKRLQKIILKGGEAAARAPGRASAAGGPGGDGRSAREEDRPQTAARRGAELPDVPGRIPEVRAQPPELGRRGRAAHAAVLLRHGAGQRHDGGTGAGQGAGDQVPDDRRAASRRHAHGVLRTERAAARGHDPRPQAASDGAGASPRPTPMQPGQIGAPIPGVVSTVAVELNQKLKKGDRLLVMEAMKMQSTVYAPVAGTVTQVLVQPGQQVEAKDLLLVIE